MAGGTALGGSAAVGVIGLGVMGSSLCLNIAQNAACRVAGFDISEEKARKAAARAQREGDLALEVHTDMDAFVRSLVRPRRVVLLVPAGKAVDAALDQLAPLLAAGDTIVDMGNEWYQVTERRQEAMAKRNLLFLGCGISGGEMGARTGPCLMPSGPAEGWTQMQPIFQAISAKTAEGRCVAYLGQGAAGNYVKMVHNGIEYGDMQLIGEAYHLLRDVGGMSNVEASAVFAAWAEGPLKSYLVEITAAILRTRDDNPAEGCAPDASLVDLILDSCGSKGTGKWTVQEAAEQGVPAATMAAALDARYTSSLVVMRRRAASRMPFRAVAAVLPVLQPLASFARAVFGVLRLAPPLARLASRFVGWPLVCTGPGLVDDLEAALFSAKLCSYAQGLSLIQSAADEKGWQVELSELARIWKGGCIIRADILDNVREAVVRREDRGDSILLDSGLAVELDRRQEGWRRTVMRAVEHGVPTPALSASLAFYDSLRQSRMPGAALIQAQRDFFGGHTYKRIDRDGTFHTKWAQ